MASKLPSTTLRRAQLPQGTSPSVSSQNRHASFIRRPHRPYTFTQLVTLSDGSTYTHRTTSPLPIFKTTKDTRNHYLWQPSLDSLRNVEQDEAGRLRAFREKFGRGWDLEGAEEEEVEVRGKKAGGSGDSKGVKEKKDAGWGEESLMDLISGGFGDKK